MSLCSCRLGRPIVRSRLPFIIASCWLITARAASAAILTGQIADPDGRGLGCVGAIGGRLRVFARGLNLSDRKHEELLGYRALGRCGMAGMRVAAGR